MLSLLGLAVLEFPRVVVVVVVWGRPAVRSSWCWLLGGLNGWWWWWEDGRRPSSMNSQTNWEHTQHSICIKKNHPPTLYTIYIVVSVYFSLSPSTHPQNILMNNYSSVLSAHGSTQNVLLDIVIHCKKNYVKGEGVVVGSVRSGVGGIKWEWEIHQQDKPYKRHSMLVVWSFSIPPFTTTTVSLSAGVVWCGESWRIIINGTFRSERYLGEWRSVKGKRQRRWWWCDP